MGSPVRECACEQLGCRPCHAHFVQEVQRQWELTIYVVIALVILTPFLSVACLIYAAKQEQAEPTPVLVEQPEETQKDK